MDKIRFGIIGAGLRGILALGKTLLERPDCEILALADPNIERLKMAQGQLGGIPLRLHVDMRDLVAERDIDIVMVTSPDHLHGDHIVAALKAGKHVFADKPLAINTAQCKEIVRVSRETDRIVDMGFNLRYDAVCRKMKELVAGGAIGRLMLVENHDYYAGGRTYMCRWNRFYEKSGGLFCHKGSHDLDLINWLNPDGLPVTVSALAGVNVFTPDGLPFPLEPGEEAGPYCETCRVAYKCKDRHNNTVDMFHGKAPDCDGYHLDTCMYLSEKNTHDNGIAIVEYDNGMRASHSECFFTPLNERRFSLVGDRGHLDANTSTNCITVYPRWTKDRTEYRLSRPEGGHGGADPTMIETLIRNFRTRTIPFATLRDGTLSVAVAEAAERSRREGRTVKIDELLTRAELKDLFGQGKAL